MEATTARDHGRRGAAPAAWRGRRHWAIVGLLLAGIGGGWALAGGAPAAEPGPAGEPLLTHGPMLGNVQSSSVRVRVRTPRPMEYAVRYAESADLSGVLKYAESVSTLDPKGR
jgi:hypothetical protein